jgi:hypothetical protein
MKKGTLSTSLKTTKEIRNYIAYSSDQTTHSSTSCVVSFLCFLQTLRNAKNEHTVHHVDLLNVYSTPIIWSCSLPDILYSTALLATPMCSLMFVLQTSWYEALTVYVIILFTWYTLVYSHVSLDVGATDTRIRGIKSHVIIFFFYLIYSCLLPCVAWYWYYRHQDTRH